MNQTFSSQSEKIMKQVEQSEQFCEIGKKAVKLHLMGLSVTDIAKALNQDEEKIRDTINKMNSFLK